jgi:hypothetical protein
MNFSKKNYEYHKTNKYFVIEDVKRNDKMTIRRAIWTLILFYTFLLILISCNEDSNDSNPPQSQKGIVTGTVKDKDNNNYPGTVVTISKGAEEVSAKTNSEGIFTINTQDIGAYTIAFKFPLATEVVGSIPTTVIVQNNQTTTIDVIIDPQSIIAHLNFGNVQLLEEIKDKDGNTPIDSNEPLYAENIFDPPLGLLTAIKAPDEHHIILSEFEKAKGNLKVHCNGNTATVQINLEGMIPNGTYTFWLAYLNKKRSVGENIDFVNDFVFPNNPPLGSGSENVLIANTDGKISASIVHSSCILTDEIALVIPILYHLNGNTFGSGHVPDEEEVVQMLAYFQ